MKTSSSKVLRSGLLAFAMSGFLIPAASEARPLPTAKPRVTIELGSGPPSLRIETHGRPPSRRHVWVPGHWDWSRRRHDWVWRPGEWRVPPRGRGHWVAPTYQRGRDGWIVIRGRWDKDRDNDGRPDHRDRDGGRGRN